MAVAAHANQGQQGKSRAEDVSYPDFRELLIPHDVRVAASPGAGHEDKPYIEWRVGIASTSHATAYKKRIAGATPPKNSSLTQPETISKGLQQALHR